MASSGWQGQKDIFTAHYPHMALNLNVWDVAHSGTTLTFKATVRVIVTSGNIYCNGVTASVTGGGSQTKNMNPVSTGSYVDFGTFSCTVNNVPAATTSYTVSASMSSGCRSDGGSGPNIGGSAQWAIDIGSGGSAPSGLSVTNISSTWNSVTATYSVGNWGGLSAGYAAARLFGNTGSARLENQFNGQSSFTTTITNNSTPLDGGITIKGCGTYRLDLYASTSAGNADSSDTTVYTAPAPGQLSYTDPGGAGTKVFPVEYTGFLANTDPGYDYFQVTRCVRYKIDDGAWDYVENTVAIPVDDITSFTISVPAGSYATVEGWMEYHGLTSEVSTVTIPNNNNPFGIYGSVNDESVATIKWYGSLNNETKKIIKIYGSHEGVARKLFEDV